MTKVNKYIEIVASSNVRLNAMAKDTQASILAVLSKHYEKVGITIVDNLADLQKLVAKQPDLVVLGMKLILLDPSKSYDDSPKIWLSDYLTQYGINFTGSDTDALMVEYDKPVAKQKVLDAGLQTSAYFVSTINQPTFKHHLSFPLFVKPTNRGDSKGVDEKSVIYSQRDLEFKIESIHNDCSSDALIEEYLSGREYSVAVIKQAKSGDLLAMPVEITMPADKKGHFFLSAQVKEADTEKTIAIDDLELRDRVSTLAINVFEVLGSRDYGRIDVRLDAFGVPSFIEANLMPGLSSHGYLARCCTLNGGIAYDDMILSIVELALVRATNPLIDALNSLETTINKDTVPAVLAPATPAATSF